jgi:hypothetical protein
MPNFPGTSTRGQELACKINQPRDGVARHDWYAQVCATHQEPSVIMINSPVSKIKRSSTDVTTTIVDGEKEPAGQVRERRLAAESNVEPRHERSNVGHASRNSGERRGDDVPNALMGLGWQVPDVPYRSDEATWQRVGQAANLQAGTRGELELTVAELLRDPAQPAERRTRGLPAWNPNPYHSAILGNMWPQHPWAAVRVSHARHRK